MLPFDADCGEIEYARKCWEHLDITGQFAEGHRHSAGPVPRQLVCHLVRHADEQKEKIGDRQTHHEHRRQVAGRSPVTEQRHQDEYVADHAERERQAEGDRRRVEGAVVDPGLADGFQVGDGEEVVYLDVDRWTSGVDQDDGLVLFTSRHFAVVEHLKKVLRRHCTRAHLQERNNKDIYIAP